jgi:lipopolysaccharide transport system permease protein
VVYRPPGRKQRQVNLSSVLTSVPTATPTASQPSLNEDGSFSRTIRPPRGIELELRELWQQRELLGFFVWRNVSVRYKQSLAGPGWAILQPLVSMVIFTVVFGNLAGLPNDGIPYPVFYFTAFIVWTYFANAVTLGSSSIVENQAIVSKVYFPRIFLPTGAALAGLIDLAIAALIAVPLMLAYGVEVEPRILLFPAPVLVATLAGTGLALILGALNARYRDVRLIVPFLVQIGLYTSPVAFSSSVIPSGLHTLYGLNPMAGAIDGLRWCVTGSGGVTMPMFLVSAATASVLLIVGVGYFQRADTSIADVV